MSEQKKQISISEVIQDLKDGLDRKAIQEKYGLRTFEATELFKHPKLKGVRVRIPVSFELVDDTVDAPKRAVKAAVAANPNAEQTPVHTPGKRKAAVAQESTTEIVDDTVEEAASAPTQSEGIKEVASEDDNIDDTVQGNTGLW